MRSDPLPSPIPSGASRAGVVSRGGGGTSAAVPLTPNLLAFFVLCAAGTTGTLAQERPPFPPPPPWERPAGPPPDRPDNRLRVPVPAAQQPEAKVLSALAPEQKTAGFSGSAQASIEGQFLLVRSDGLPDHPTDPFPTNYNPNRILPQDYRFRIPLAPKFAEKPTPLPFGPIGVALNGVPFYNPYNREGRDAVMGPNAEIFDSCCGHPDQRGRYHYHKYPVCLRSPFPTTAEGQHSPLIGWAFDGFAIYGPNGETGQPPADLDECNGHSDAVRGYHYHVTAKFPYILGAYRGVIEMSNFPGPQVWGGPRR